MTQLQHDEMLSNQPKPNATGTLWILLTSSLGMAGSFTMAMFKEFLNNFKKETDKVIVLGEKGYKFIVNNYGEDVVVKHLSLNEKPEDFIYIKYISKLVNKLFKNGNFKDVKIQYSKFKNSTSFAPHISQILPIDEKSIEKSIAQSSSKMSVQSFLIEPSPINAYHHTMDMYLQSTIYAAFLETKLCEHLSRKNAMLEASANEDTKMHDLKMAYNKKRQEKITAEVSLLSLTL
ncbi:MAG: F0F1 ATP synthase subunit gamma [Mycoplasmataceae bacterium]|nr:F0F1 ATP synthase subunit gamma [Mycoplasmataceae bacterium]